MLKLSQLLDTKKRDALDANTPDSPPQSRPPPQSPLTVDSSAPVSPAPSLLSAKGHTPFSSSVSSLVSSPALGNSMECPSRNQLSGVREEPCGCEASHLDQEYFQHFDQGMGVAEDAYFSSFDYSDGYDLADPCLDNVYSPEKRRSSGSSVKGISRIGSRISTVSARWKPGRSSVGADEDASLPYDPRSRANSASSAFAGPAMSLTTRVDASIPPSPARAIFEEPVSESATRPIDIAKQNHENDDSAPQATTPLLPPFMGDDPTSSVVSRVQSPLQSPSVAGMTEEPLASSITELRLAGVPSPPLSSKPSIASFGRPTHTVRSTSGDASPFTLSDPKDEWANKLGHANFSIQPEPYVPEAYDMETFQHFRGQWDLARCNFAKHLVRTGEHYGVTSNIYKLTEEKWESINREWKHHHESMLSELDPSECAGLNQTKSHHPCEQLKIPRLHDNDKFPELGDQEIVGPMKMAPTMGMSGPCRNRSLKRDFVRFFHGLVTRS